MTRLRNDLTRRHLGTVDIFCPLRGTLEPGTGKISKLSAVGGLSVVFSGLLLSVVALGKACLPHLPCALPPSSLPPSHPLPTPLTPSPTLLPQVLSPLHPLLHAFVLLLPFPHNSHSPLSFLPPPLLPLLPALDPPPLGPRAERGGQGAMVTHSRRNPPAMSSVPPPGARGQGSEMPPQRYKPFSSHAHYQQVLCAVRKLQESGFYWGAVGGREASSLLRSQPPGTFLVRDSSDHHYFFTLSVQTACGTKNLRIHSQGESFYLQPDPQCSHTPPRFDCVLKLIGHYMGKEGGGGGGGGEVGGSAAEGDPVGPGSVYLIHSGGEKVPLELRRPLPSSLSSLQHLCRRTLNGHPRDTHQLPHTVRDFLEEYDAPI